MVNKDDYIILFKQAYKYELDAEDYASELSKELEDNRINLQMSKEILADEKKHQKIVLEIIQILKNS